MKTDAAKEYALEVCKDWRVLDIKNMTDALPPWCSLTDWKLEGDRMQLHFRADIGFNFESWAMREWKWPGKFDATVTWLTGRREPDDQQWLEYEISKEDGENPKVLDLRNGSLWMQAP